MGTTYGFCMFNNNAICMIEKLKLWKCMKFYAFQLFSCNQLFNLIKSVYYSFKAQLF